MKRKLPPEAAIRDKAALKKWLRFDPAVRARDAMYTCGECGHAAHALPGSCHWSRPASLYCNRSCAHIHRRTRACEHFTPRGEYNGLIYPNEEWADQLAQVQNSIFHIGDYATARYVRHIPRPNGGFYFTYELENHAEPMAGAKTPIVLEELWGWPVHTLENHLCSIRANWVKSGYIKGTEIRKEPKP